MSEIQSAPTPDPSSTYLTPQKKGQRIYQSFSSAFSKKASTRGNSPEPTSPSPANLPDIFQSPLYSSPTPEEVPRPMENEEEVKDSGCGLIQEPEIDEPGTAPAQPQFNAKGGSGGEFAFALTIEEVTSALEDLKRILKSPCM